VESIYGPTKEHSSRSATTSEVRVRKTSGCLRSRCQAGNQGCQIVAATYGSDVATASIRRSYRLDERANACSVETRVTWHCGYILVRSCPDDEQPEIGTWPSLTASTRSHRSLVSGPAITCYVPFCAGATSSRAPFGFLGHKITNDTKASQSQFSELVGGPERLCRHSLLLPWPRIFQIAYIPTCDFRLGRLRHRKFGSISPMATCDRLVQTLDARWLGRGRAFYTAIVVRLCRAGGASTGLFRTAPSGLFDGMIAPIVPSPSAGQRGIRVRTMPREHTNIASFYRR
jgi:hypothetical protein